MSGAAFEITSCGKPDLVIRPDDYTITAADLAVLAGASGEVFNRGGPVQIIPESRGAPRVARMTVDRAVILAHRIARPVVLHSDGSAKAQTLPERVARLYLAGEHLELPPLDAVTSAPLLASDGAIRTAVGYDPESATWCAPPSDIAVPERPSGDDARAALQSLRSTFRTFPFGDARTIERDGIRLVDLSEPPGEDESAFLVMLLTAVCRPSLPLAPGMLVAAPQISGAGTGKGKLVRAITMIAYGSEPHAFTPGKDKAELEKRIAAALLEATQVLFIDNANGEAMSNDLLASILTEATVGVRPLGASRMILLSPKAFVAITGNGVTLSEDLARRFISIRLDARTADPEARPFRPGFLADIAARRAALLGAALTVWRWGRQQGDALPYGRPLGSYEEWGHWVRDPFLALGCADPVNRVHASKANDPLRQAIGELYEEWWRQHANRPVRAVELSEAVQAIIDPHGRGRQFVASFLASHVGTRASGCVLTMQKGGRWSAATYALRRDGVPEVDEMPPMPPMVCRTPSR